jgi:hypothetical protein
MTKNRDKGIEERHRPDGSIGYREKVRIKGYPTESVTFFQVPSISIDEGIDAVRYTLSKCWFDAEKCSQGIKALESYRRQWNDSQGCWSSKPHHDQ